MLLYPLGYDCVKTEKSLKRFSLEHRLAYVTRASKHDVVTVLHSERRLLQALTWRNGVARNSRCADVVFSFARTPR